MVTRAMNDADPEVRRAATRVNAAMWRIEDDPDNTMSLKVGGLGPIDAFRTRMHGGAATYKPVWGLFNNDARVVMNPDRIANRLHMDIAVALAHEVGHADAIMRNLPDQRNPAVHMENDARVIKGCGGYRRSDYRLPQPCQ